MRRRVVIATAAASLVLAAPAVAVTGFGPEFRVSTTVSPDEPNRGGSSPHAANNTVTGETFVVWSSDQVADNQFEVSGQMLAADGSDLGGDFVISSLSSTSGGGAPTHDVAVDSEHDRYLVVYSGDDSDAGNLRDIWARLYDGNGAPLTAQFRVPFFVYGASQEGFVPQAAVQRRLRPVARHLVGQPLGSGRTEVFGRALSMDGVPLGTEDLVISERSTGYASQGGASYNTVAVSSTGEYFVAFSGSKHPDPHGEKEIWLQRLTSALAPTPNGTDVLVTETPTGGAGHAVMPTTRPRGDSSSPTRPPSCSHRGRRGLARVIDGTGAFVTGETQVSNNPADPSRTRRTSPPAAGASRSSS